MKVLFVYPDIMEDFPRWCGHDHLGLGSLAAVLKEGGHSVSLLHLTGSIARDEYLNRLGVADPDLIAISTTSLMFDYARLYAAWTKEWRNIPVLCGGVHATLHPEEVIADTNFDIICIGEGEEPLLDLCEALRTGSDYSMINNLWVRQGSSVQRNGTRPLISNLDQLPFPDRSIFYQENSFRRQGIARVMASRGCPYKCAYCCNEAKRRASMAGGGRYVRFRSPANVIAEIKTIQQREPSLTSIWFDDDILPLGLEWFEEFVARYQREISLPYECNLRPNLATEDVVKLLAESGCWRVHMGVESGNEQIRKAVLNRHITDEQIRNAFALCHRYNIETVSLNMVGLPTEDMSAILDTIKLNAEINPSCAFTLIFYPFRGTALHDYCHDRRLLTGRKVANLLTQSVLRSNVLADEQVELIRVTFEWLIQIYRTLSGIRGGRLWIEPTLDAILCAKWLSAPFLRSLFFIRSAVHRNTCILHSTRQRGMSRQVQSRESIKRQE